MNKTDTLCLQVKGMDCPDCASKIEKGVRQLEGIQSVQVDFVTSQLTVEGSVPIETLQKRVTDLGYQIEDQPQSFAFPTSVSFSFSSFFQHLTSQSETRLGLAGGALFIISLVLEYLGIIRPVVISIQLLGLGIAGFPLLKSGISNLIINRDFNINLLMSIAAVGAIIIGNIEEGVSLILLFVLAEALEGYTTERARGVLGELVELAPEEAIRLNGDLEETVKVEQLVPGDLLLVKSGERIPMDGEVIRGTSEVNQAPITGESIPVLKEPGDSIYAGTVNGRGVLEIRVTGTASNNTLARIIRMITDAQSTRSARERMIDRFAHYYTPAMFVLAVLVAVVPPLLFNQPFFNPADGSRGWFYRALALLVISCPCALVLSTPVATISAITRAARQGILFKGGAYIESLSRIKAFAFDKTGTLTRGEPTVAFTRSVDCKGGENCENCTDVLALASSLERRSTHPLARAVINAAEEQGVADQYPPAESVTISSGRGISGIINGKEAVLASHKHFDDHYEHSSDLCSEVTTAEENGHTTMLLYSQEKVSGYIAVKDQPRSESASVIAQLKEMGKVPVMLTGDNTSTAVSIGRLTGIEVIHSHLLPEEKVQAIQNLKSNYHQVAMIGDGINDAPAMATADLGISMGGAASAQAMETAEIILMAANLSQLPFAIRLSAYTRKIILQNLAVSLGIKILFIGLTFLGWIPLWLAVAADSGMAVVVVLNSLRPLKFTGSA